MKIEDNEHNKIICKFPILHHKWEYDAYGYIIEKDNQRILILTNHGKSYNASIEELYDKIAEYKNAIQETERAIFLLK
jgi:hypothetical protein